MCIYCLLFWVITVFIFDIRSCCSCLACRSWWRRWRLRLSVQHSTAPTTLTGPSQTTRTCGSLEGDTSTRTSSARTNMLNTSSTVTCRTNWVSSHHLQCVCVFNIWSLKSIYYLVTCSLLDLVNIKHKKNSLGHSFRGHQTNLQSNQLVLQHPEGETRIIVFHETYPEMNYVHVKGLFGDSTAGDVV